MADNICINHDAAANEVNLLQVAGIIKGRNNARRHVHAAMKALSMPSREDKKIRGKGQTVLVGTYDEAIQVSTYLDATMEQLLAIKEALKACAEKKTVNKKGRDSKPKTMLQKFIRALKSEEPFPLKFTKGFSSWLGYKHLSSARAFIKELLCSGALLLGTDVRETTFGRNLSTGKSILRFEFAVSGIKKFVFLQRHTPLNIRSALAAAVDTGVFVSLLPEHFPSETRMLEVAVRNRLAKALGGDTEVVCNHGKADIVTSTEVIEVKKAEDYKHAIGQVLAYSHCFPTMQKRIHLFGKPEEIERYRLRAEQVCSSCNINVSWERC